jgi:hypothetical protein
LYHAALARARATLGQAHHRVALAEEGKRVNCYVEPAKP